MSAKYIITHIDGRLVSAEYDNNICVGLDILSPTGVMGNIYVIFLLKQTTTGTFFLTIKIMTN